MVIEPSADKRYLSKHDAACGLAYNGHIGHNHHLIVKDVRVESMCKMIALILSGLCFCSAANAQWSDWKSSISTRLSYEDNVNTAARNSDKKSDEALEARLNLGRSYTLLGSNSTNTRLGLQGHLSKSKQNNYDGLSWVGYGATAKLSHKLGLGPQVTRLEANVSAEYRDTDDTYREAWYYTGVTSLSRRFSQRLDTSLALKYHNRNGTDFGTFTPQISNNVYDQEYWEIGLTLRHRTFSRTRTRLSVNYLNGEFDSRCGAVSQEDFDQLALNPKVKALGYDDTFHDCRWLLDGDGYRVQAGADIALGGAHKLKLDWIYRDIQLDDDRNYSSGLYSVRYLYEF
jgi:hypothetical protein